MKLRVPSRLSVWRRSAHFFFRVSGEMMNYRRILRLGWGLLLAVASTCTLAADNLPEQATAKDQTPAGDKAEPDPKFLPKSTKDSTPLKLENEPLVDFVNSEIRNQWVLHKLPPSPFANDEEWLRRVTLDILGHIPTLEETEKFLRDESPAKREAWLDKILESPDYARNWASLWTNLLIGRRTPDRIDREGLRAFLERAFARNQPWNELVVELIGAEGSQKENGAVNFLLAHLNDAAVPATSLTARLFLGTQLQCTQCHNHPFNDWKQNQFWELNSFFSQTRRFDHQHLDPETKRLVFDYAELIFVDGEGPVHFEQRNGLVRVAYPIYEGIEIAPDNRTKRRQELARLMTRPDSDQLARAMVNRIWGHFFGVGFTRPVDDLGPHRPPSHPQVLERLSAEFHNGGYDIKKLIRWVCATEAYQLTSRSQAGNALDDPSQGLPPRFSHMMVKSMTPEQLFDSLQVAVKVHGEQRPEWKEWEDRRRNWLQQFVLDFGTDENDESTTFNGTIPQALVMMNGTLVRDALNSQNPGLLKLSLEGERKDVQRIQILYLATLGRHPTSQEVGAARNLLAANETVEQSCQDLLWALINSNEFISNH